ncbi:ATP-dependent DNA ligase Cdc17, partial [Coemansia spiralis]
MKQSMLATFFSGATLKSKPTKREEKAPDGETAVGATAEPAAEQSGSETGEDMPEASSSAFAAPGVDTGVDTGVDRVRRGRKRQAVSSDSSDASTHMDEDEAAPDAGAAASGDSSSEDGPVAKMPKSARGKASAKPAAKKAKAQAVTLPTGTIELVDTNDGKQVPFQALCAVFEDIEATTKRLEITAMIRDFLYKAMAAGQAQLKDVVLMCINKVAPDHEGIELGIGESALIKAIASATGRQAARIKQDHKELGDLGMVAQRSKTNQRTMFKPKPLSVTHVLETFKEIAQTSGSSSIQKKTGLIAGLLAACSTSSEAKYLIRSLEGRLRIGLAESTVQVALAHAALLYETKRDDIEPEELQKATNGLKQVLSEYPVYDSVINAIYEHGISDVANHCMLTPTLPVKPMLAKIEKAAGDILRRFEGRPFTCEYKYDGERSQIHYVREADGSERCVVFSRNAENNTAKYPDIAGSVKEFAHASVTSFILDCEAVAWDRESGKI